jgi:hypothetical protein
MKNYEFDYEMYPDGISEEVYDLEPSVWDCMLLLKELQVMLYNL